MSENVIEEYAAEEYREGVSAGAAARQLCRSLGASGTAPTLRRLLEDLLADGNRSSHDRHMILQAFEAAAPEEAQAAKRESFDRVNGRDPASAAPVEARH